MQHDLKKKMQTMWQGKVLPSLLAIRTRGDLSVLTAAVRGTLGMRYEASTNEDHLRTTMAWLCTAQDATTNDGVSAFYDAEAGTWAPSYPETTGYIIPTFFDYAAYVDSVGPTDSDVYRTRAVRMANWLLTLQLENGAFPMGPLWTDLEPKPIVFDTGQIILGLIRSFEETNDSRYIEAAKRAGNWLAEIQEHDGSWHRFTFRSYAATYNARVAWALLRLNRATPNESYRVAAIRNLQWTLTKQTSDGWFHNASFGPGEEPLTHTLAYTIRGLLESGLLLSEQQLFEAARLSADALLNQQMEHGYLLGTYGPRWQSNVKWSCLTGNAQVAIIWLRLYEMTFDKAYIQAAGIANNYIKQVQNRHSELPGIKGGIAGSCPIYGGYHPYLFVNWAAKFFVDSLLLEKRLLTEGGIA